MSIRFSYGIIKMFHSKYLRQQRHYTVFIFIFSTKRTLMPWWWGVNSSEVKIWKRADDPLFQRIFVFESTELNGLLFLFQGLQVCLTGWLLPVKACLVVVKKTVKRDKTYLQLEMIFFWFASFESTRFRSPPSPPYLPISKHSMHWLSSIIESSDYLRTQYFGVKNYNFCI